MTPSPLSPFTQRSDRLQIRVRVTPNASADRIGPVAADETGTGWLQVAVTAAPENGRANRAVIALLAKRWRLPKSSFALVRGATDRRKTFEISDADPGALRARLETAIDG